jgi:amidase
VSGAWHRRGVAELGAAMAAGTLTSEALVQACLARIASLGRAGPGFNAVREVTPRAVDTARGLDAERRAGRLRGPLHGIPVLLKDNIATGDGMACTAGSLALADLRPPHDAGLVHRLRAAGAVVLGKCNLTEFADYLSDVMPSEFSSAGGVVRHPYGLRYDRGGGSSIGPACAVAAGLAPLAVGSETQNSLQTPASDSAVVAIKPTVGLVSRAGMVPLAISQDTAGPMARSVADAAALLSVLAGVDPADGLTLTAAGHVHADYTRFLDAHAAHGARIGVARAVYFGREGRGAHEAVVEGAIGVLRETGAIIVDPADVPTAAEVARVRSSVFAREFKVGLEAFLAGVGEAAPLRTLAEVVAFNAAHPAECLRYGQVLAERAAATTGLDDPAYHADRLRDVTLARALGLDAVFARYGLDALLAPAGAAAKLTGKAGYPVVTVPVGLTPEGAPVGISLIGPAWSEPRLVALAHAYEQARGPVAPPPCF